MDDCLCVSLHARTSQASHTHCGFSNSRRETHKFELVLLSLSQRLCISKRATNNMSSNKENSNNKGSNDDLNGTRPLRIDTTREMDSSIQIKHNTIFYKCENSTSSRSRSETRI